MAKKFYYRKKFRIILQVAILLTLWAQWGTACARSKEKEYYTERDTCYPTQVTCWAGDPRPENIIYNSVVCRYYFEYGELSVAVLEKDLPTNVVLTRKESCVFRRV